MRILNRSNLGFVGAVILGLLVAWLVAVPTRTTGERLRGNCRKCIMEALVVCPNQLGGTCKKSAYQCVVLPTAKGACYRGTPSGCIFDEDCQSTWHEACMGV